MPRDYRDIVGRGTAFPLDVTSTGTMQWSVPLEGATDVDRQDAMHQRIEHLVLTLVGERVLYREYGTDLVPSLFNLVQPALVSTVLRRMVDAINRWEPRVHIVDADVHTIAEDGTVTFVLHWRLPDSSLDGTSVLNMGLNFKETI